jgi:protein TonB
VLLRFLLARDGRVLGAELERSSGHDLLDKEVLALIRRAEPLPSFPAELTQQQLELVLPVPFSLR